MSTEDLNGIKAIRDALPNMPEFLRQELDADIEKRERELSQEKGDAMPYNESQHKLFEAAAHDPEVAARKGITQATAARLAHEGVKKDNASGAETPARRAIKVRIKKLIK